MNDGEKFDAMRFVVEHPEKTKEVTKNMEDGLPTERIERKKRN